MKFAMIVFAIGFLDVIFVGRVDDFGSGLILIYCCMSVVCEKVENRGRTTYNEVRWLL